MSQSTPINRLPRNNPGNANNMVMPGTDPNVPAIIPNNQLMAMSQQMPQGQMPQQMPGQMPQQMPGQMPQQMPGQMPQQMSQQMPGQMPQQMPNQDNNQLVDDILREMGTPPGTDNSSINSDMMGYSMDPSQIPPEKIPGNYLDNSDPYLDEALPNQMAIANSSGGLLGINFDTSTTTGKIAVIAKNPLLVFVIALLLSLPQFNRLLFGFFPRLLLESGQVSFYGVMLKAVLGVVIFVGVNFLV